MKHRAASLRQQSYL